MAKYMLKHNIINRTTHSGVMADPETKCVPALDNCDDICYSAVDGPLFGLTEYTYDVRGLAYMPPSYYI
ncbi:hypothetical protein PMIN02_004098 [Paraphaeosphaeria minitans]